MPEQLSLLPFIPAKGSIMIFFLPLCYKERSNTIEPKTKKLNTSHILILSPNPNYIRKFENNI